MHNIDELKDMVNKVGIKMDPISEYVASSLRKLTEEEQKLLFSLSGFDFNEKYYGCFTDPNFNNESYAISDSELLEEFRAEEQSIRDYKYKMMQSLIDSENMIFEPSQYMGKSMFGLWDLASKIDHNSDGSFEILMV